MSNEAKQILKRALESSAKFAPMSLHNAHHPGLNSLVLDDQGRRLLRLFHKPAGVVIRAGDIAIHAHHCNIALTPILGTIVNKSARPATNGTLYGTWRYKSKINCGVGCFKQLRGMAYLAITETPISTGQRLTMTAKHLHTIECSADEAAWIVEEGQEDADYDAVCYSKKSLASWSSEGLYQPMTEQAYQGIIQALSAQL